MLKRIVLLIGLLIPLTFNIYAIDGSFYVGEPFYLDNPSVSGIIDAIAWYSDRPNNIGISKRSGGASVVINEYFSGTSTIECQYGYTYYVGTTKTHSTGHAYFQVSCRSSNATLSNTDVYLSPGEKFTLSYTNSSGFKIPEPYFKVNDPTVATVDDGEWSTQQSVTIKAVRPGSCTITFYPKNGGSNPVCNVTVRNIPATSIKLSPKKIRIRVGKSGSFRVETTPTGATNAVTWSSNDNSVASINEKSGSISGVSIGNTTVTATTDNGLRATGEVEIVPVPEAITLPETIQITQGFSTKLTPTPIPVNAEATYKWSSADKTIVTVDSGGNVKGLNLGHTTLTITTDNGKSCTTEVTVVAPQEGLDIRNISARVQYAKKIIDKTLQQIK